MCPIRAEKLEEPMLQIDLNVTKAEDQRLPLLYPGDSINMTTIRLYFNECDGPAVVQMIKDHHICPAIWNDKPIKSTREEDQ